MADETTCIGGVEQLSLCARYVDLKQAVVREEFLQFIPVTDMTGRGLTNAILSSLSTIGVSTEYLRAEAYDGAASMTGAYNGVQAHAYTTTVSQCHLCSLRIAQPLFKPFQCMLPDQKLRRNSGQGMRVFSL